MNGDAGAISDAGPDAGPDAGDPADLAPRRWPLDPNPVTHDVDTVLDAVLERSALAGACDAVAAGAADRATRLKCGKDMFFREAFGTVGVPTKLLVFLQKHYAQSYFGAGFSNFGFAPDSTNSDGIPIGLAPTTGTLGKLETRAFTCAACHFGQLPDGRWAVGYSNLKLDYGRFIASMGAPLVMSIDANSAQVAPEVRAALAGPVAQAKQNPLYLADVASVGIGLATSGATGNTQLNAEEQSRFWALRPGTMDFLTKPLIEDNVWTVSRILALWQIPDATQRAAHGMPHELLSWTGGVENAMTFLEGFVAIGKADPALWPDSRLQPLDEYLRTLRPPPLADTTETPQIHAGARLFTQRCLGCHSGPSGEGVRVFEFSEVGTDSAYRYIFNPDQIPGGTPCCGLGGAGQYVVTGGVKAPRLAGLVHMTGLLHNGSVRSLEELFCLALRDPTTTYAETSAGHAMTCDGLSDDDKRALIAYLRTL
ncbi:MAG: c-type cytochrome [Deltaproteobacteria bacterium]|nr:c-type cytochrome [Deltaproteobacteria bacterium]